MQEKKTHHKLDEIINIIFLELPKMKKLFNEQPVEKLSKIQKWCKFFVDADDPAKQTEVTKLAETEAGIMKAMTTLSKISNDDIMWKKQLDRDIALSDYTTMMNNMKRAKEAAKKADEYERQIKEAEKVIAQSKEAAKKADEYERKIKEAEKTIAKAKEAEKTIAKAKEAEKTIAKAKEAEKIIEKAIAAGKIISNDKETERVISELKVTQQELKTSLLELKAKKEKFDALKKNNA